MLLKKKYWPCCKRLIELSATQSWNLKTLGKGACIMYGYTGKLLYVDLSRMLTEVRDIPEEIRRNYIGGAGWGAKLLYEGTDKTTDPLGVNNMLCFVTGPLTGMKISGAGRHSIVCKSPLTGVWGEASVGGSWGRELKMTGYDGIVVTGKAAEPVYLWINNGEVVVRNAGHVWGKDTYETDEILRRETDPKAVVSCIGQAGENLLPIAGIFTDGIEGRTAARCGVGAVQGSKNLKAIVVKGSIPVNVADSTGLDTLVKKILPDFVKKTAGLRKFGTAGLVIGCEQSGDFPVKNWRLGKWEEGALKISGPAMNDTILKKNFYCAGCAVGCGRNVEVQEGEYAPVKGGGPEYETLGLFGGSCLVDNLDAIAKGNEMCNRYGIDTIDVGNAIAMAMEAYENGLITEKTAGCKLEWGSGSALLEMIRQIGENRGLGAILGKGITAAAKEIGGNCSKYAIHSKGLSFPSHDPRAFTSLALGYATSPRGACHLQAFSHAFERALTMPDVGIDAPLERFTTVGKADLVAKMQNVMALFDSLCLCKFNTFGGFDLTLLVDLLNNAAGMTFEKEEILLAGERIFNLKRLYNIECGLSGKDDTISDRILHEPRGSGGAADNLPDLQIMLTEYYQIRGWDVDGRPTHETIARLFPQ